MLSLKKNIYIIIYYSGVDKKEEKRTYRISNKIIYKMKEKILYPQLYMPKELVHNIIFYDNEKYIGKPLNTILQ